MVTITALISDCDHAGDPLATPQGSDLCGTRCHDHFDRRICCTCRKKVCKFHNAVNLGICCIFINERRSSVEGNVTETGFRRDRLL